MYCIHSILYKLCDRGGHITSKSCSVPFYVDVKLTHDWMVLLCLHVYATTIRERMITRKDILHFSLMAFAYIPDTHYKICCLLHQLTHRARRRVSPELCLGAVLVLLLNHLETQKQNVLLYSTVNVK